MDNFELLEYRPGRWAKVDPATGAFLGPASAQEVRARHHERDSLPEKSPTLEFAAANTEDSRTVGERPGAGAYDEQPPAPETPPQPDTLLPAEPGEKAEPTPPQQPEPGEKAEPTPPQQPEPEEKAEPTPPQQPEPEEKAEPTPPQQPEPGEKAEPTPPQEPEPEKKAKPPAQPAPKLKGVGTGATAGMKLCWPLPKRYRITCDFQGHRQRTPPSKAPGIDLGCPLRTTVQAWASGRVMRSRWSDGGGRSLWIQHGREFKTYYAHLNCVYVLEGETVQVGQKIAESGTTGHSTGPHLHFSVIRKGKYVDPERFLVFEQAGKV